MDGELLCCSATDTYPTHAAAMTRVSAQINGVFVTAVWKTGPAVWKRFRPRCRRRQEQRVKKLKRWCLQAVQTDLHFIVTQVVFPHQCRILVKLKDCVSYPVCFSFSRLLLSRLRFLVSWVTRTSFSFMEPCWNLPTMALSQVRPHVLHVCVRVWESVCV